MIPDDEENEMFEEDETPKNMKRDKILNNSFNTGEIEFEAFTSSMKIDDKVAGQYRESWSENAIEDKTSKMLEDQLYGLFKESEFYEKYKIMKRVDKGDMIKMYYFSKKNY
ncbi:MAG: hypothetical protein HC831_25490 [Chloroflexia bacterium]|nr:hypothetical protein [Chloroflexia bacterium]